MSAATTIVLVPGMMCDHRVWTPQIAVLGNSYIPFVADLTGAATIQDMARGVLHSVPGRFAVAGLSLGGIVAFEIWRQASHRVSHMILIDTNPHAETPERAMQRLEQIERVHSGELRSVVADSLKPLYLAESHRHDEQILSVIMAMAMEMGPGVFHRQAEALRARPDSVPTLSRITCPVAVICGREDTVCPLVYHELMAREIPNAILTVIADCGHLSTLEQPAAVTSAMRRLLEDSARKLA